MANRLEPVDKINADSEFDIVKYFSSMIHDLTQYYKVASQRSDLFKVLHIIRKSCALTLSSKLNLNSSSQAFTKFCKELKMFKNKNFKASLCFPTTLETNYDFNTGLAIAEDNRNSPLIYLRKPNFMQIKELLNLWLKTKIRISSC